MRKLLKTSIFSQIESECAVCASAMCLNYYNKDKKYEDIRSVAKGISKTVTSAGMYTGEVGQLLNKIGFKKVTLVTTDLGYVDYSWNDLNKKELIKEIKEAINSKTDKNTKASQKRLYNFISNKKYKNEIIVDYDFCKYLRENLKNNRPVLVSYDWNSLFKKTKTDKYGNNDSIKGKYETHMVLAVGYDKKYVYLADSHNTKDDELRYLKKGLYKVSFEHFMSVICDLIIPEDYELV